MFTCKYVFPSLEIAIAAFRPCFSLTCKKYSIEQFHFNNRQNQRGSGQYFNITNYPVPITKRLIKHRSIFFKVPSPLIPHIGLRIYQLFQPNPMLIHESPR